MPISGDHNMITNEHPDLLKQWLNTWSSHVKQLPIQKREFFLEECLDQYLSFHEYTRHDQLSYGEYVLEVICDKPLTPPIRSEASLYQYGAIIFTQKETTVLKYYLQGKSAKEISLLLPVSAKTVEFHLAKIKEKLNCHRRSEIVQAALRHGFINLIF